MATHLANTPNIKVPDYFAVAIERVMWNKFRFFARAIYRRKVAHLSTVRKTFSERIASAGGKINVASDGRHQFLVEVLEKVRGVLKPSMEAGVFNIGEPRKPAPAADRARDPFRNMFSILGVYQPSESFLDAPDVVKPQVSAPQYVAESDGSLEEAVFALTALFDDYQSLREELSSLWAMYRAGNRDLAAVSLATNTAFEFARSMEDDIKPIMEGRAARAFCWKMFSTVIIRLTIQILIPLVKEGRITSTWGIKRITGPSAVELDDGSVINDVDAIIACVGYNSDIPMLSEVLTFVDAPGGAVPLPNLYMGIFPPGHSDSLAIMSNVHLNGPQVPGRELTAMAVAQIWAGNSSLPSKPVMDVWVRRHQDWLWKRIAQAHGLHRGDVLAIDWMKFVHDAAGTALYDNIGWSWSAWKLWWKDPALYKALAHGPATPHAFRLFETGKRAA